ncbi:MAG: ribonuclease J, partial [Pseudobdellovibrionaceae bacterium]|nr:ribonuclease J [Pseudobdellovibrionaceae bacterium]
ALELLKDKLNQLRDQTSYTFHEIKSGESCRVGHAKIDWIHVPHSIPHCSALAIDMGHGNRVFHTGDFKVRGFLPIDPDLPLDLVSKAAKASPFRVMVSDSTNAGSTGECPSENTVLSELKACFAGAQGISYLTTFSSNLWRIKSVLRAAMETQKRVMTFGAGIRRSLETAARLKLLGDEAQALVDEDGGSRLNRKDLVVLCSGCQGEYRSGLTRIINGDVHHLDVRAEDQVIFSSRVIPGNEKAIFKLISLCHEKGAKVITAREKPDIHVSGHAYAGDLTRLMQAVNPHYYMPVHGTFTQIKTNQALAPRTEQVIASRNGRVIAVGADGFETFAEFDLPLLFIDSWSRLPMSYDNMRSRHKIGDTGMAICTGLLGPQNHMQVEVEFIGLPFADQADEEACEMQILGSLHHLYQAEARKEFSLVSFNEQARLMIRRKLSERFVKKPVVISKIYAIDR